LRMAGLFLPGTVPFASLAGCVAAVCRPFFRFVARHLALRATSALARVQGRSPIAAARGGDSAGAADGLGSLAPGARKFLDGADRQNARSELLARGDLREHF